MHAPRPQALEDNLGVDKKSSVIAERIGLNISEVVASVVYECAIYHYMAGARALSRRPLSVN